MLFNSHPSTLSSDGDRYALRVSHDPGTFVIEAYGELDAHASRRMESLIERGESTSADRVLVDLSGVDFMAIAGMKVLADAEARSCANGQRLVLLRAPDHVHSAIERVGIAARLRFLD